MMISQKKMFSIRDRFIKTNIDIHFLWVFFTTTNGWKIVTDAATATINEQLSLNITDIIETKPELESFLLDTEVFGIFFPV